MIPKKLNNYPDITLIIMHVKIEPMTELYQSLIVGTNNFV